MNDYNQIEDELYSNNSSTVTNQKPFYGSINNNTNNYIGDNKHSNNNNNNPGSNCNTNHSTIDNDDIHHHDINLIYSNSNDNDVEHNIDNDEDNEEEEDNDVEEEEIEEEEDDDDNDDDEQQLSYYSSEATSTISSKFSSSVRTTEQGTTTNQTTRYHRHQYHDHGHDLDDSENNYMVDNYHSDEDDDIERRLYQPMLTSTYQKPSWNNQPNKQYRNNTNGGVGGGNIGRTPIIGRRTTTRRIGEKRSSANNNNDPSSPLFRKKSLSSREKNNNRAIYLFLFGIVFVCILAIAFLASPLSSNSNNNTYNNNSSNHYYNADNKHGSTTGTTTGTNKWKYDVNHNNMSIHSNSSNDDDMNSNNNDNKSNINSYDDDDFPYSSLSSKAFQNTINKIPFKPISRERYSIPASSIVNPSLFHPSLRNIHYDDTQPTSSTSSSSSQLLQPLLKTPIPTGAFYSNFFLSQTTSDQSISYPIMVYPYSYKWGPTKLIVSYPSIHRVYDTISIRDIFQPDLTFTIVEEIQNRFCTYYDSLSITLRYSSLDDEKLNVVEAGKDSGGEGYSSNDSGFETYLVQGSPYITIKYNNGTPIISALSIFTSFYCSSEEDQDGTNNNNTSTSSSSTGFGICSKVTTSASSSLPLSQQDVTLKGVQFILQTQENLQWLIFASEPIELTLGGLSRQTLRAESRYSGVLRIALIPPPTPDANNESPITQQQPPYPSLPSLSNSSVFKNLVYYSHVYPVGATVSWDFKTISVSSLSSSLLSPYEELTPSSHSWFRYFLDGIVDTAWNKFLSNTLFGKKNTTEDDDDISNKRTIATLSFQYDVLSMYDTSNSTNPTSASTNSDRTDVKDNLLMLALPHHAQVLPSKRIVHDFDSTYYCIKGPLTPVIGTLWSYDEILTNIEFNDVNNTEKLLSMDESVMDVIIDQVGKDLNRVLPTLTENVYGFGKQVARLANLAKIVDDLQQILKEKTNNGIQVQQNGTSATENQLATLQSLSTDSSAKLHHYLAAFLKDRNSDNLVYDANFGGVITRNGLLNMQEDFGNGWYNDHHFHYGYILYASAIMAKINSTFVDEFGLHVESLLNDVVHDANQNSNSVQGSFFPFVRHKAWYDGHSYASGLFPFADGKSQESSSEAVNCYYGAYLWTLINANIKGLNDANSNFSKRVNFMKLLLAMEIRSTKTYWHMIPPSEAKDAGISNQVQTYNPSFEQSLMVGNLGMMDVTVSTWFGPEKLYVHMINFLPVTAITKELFDPDYVKLEFEKVLDPIYENVEMAWRGYVVADKAIIDPSVAWSDAKELTSYELDSALSQSQVYYWISTMNGFVAPNFSQQQSSQGDTTATNNTSGSMCSSHGACVSSGLTGDCCPTSAGVMLGCCNQDVTSLNNQVTSNASSSEDSASCDNHASCATNGLSGLCCPTSDGTMLGCCNS